MAETDTTEDFDPSTLDLRTAADVVSALESRSGRLDKERIVQAAWDAGITVFFEGAVMAYDALRTYGVKKVPLIEDGDDDPMLASTFTWERFKEIASKLETRELSGNTARDVLRAAADSASVRDWNGFYRRVLLKDFKCGCTDSTINKVLKKNGKDAERYIIPEFSCQLAKPGEDHPKKMTGPKLLDIKLDGVRILSFLDKDRNEVTHYTREGRINTNFPHIAAMQAKLLPSLKCSMVLDGEMVSRSFQALMQQLNRSEADTKDAKLALFDCLPMEDFLAGECKLTQTQRHEALVQFQPLLDQHSGGTIYVVPKLAVDLSTEAGQKTFKEFNRDAIDAGYEGVMIKDPSATYQTKRTFAWLKIKPKITVDLTVVGFEPGKAEGKFSETLGGMICEGEDQGRKILVTVGGGYSEALRDEIWANQDKVLGRIAEIEADAITKPKTGETYGLRFPQFARFRGWAPGEKL
jgi:DNA ligase-1